MTQAGPGERLPRSIDGLFDIAYAGYVANIGLYLALAALIFAVYVGIEFAPWPADGVAQSVAYYVAPLIVDGLLVAAVALGIGVRIGGKDVARGALLAAAFDRWLPVLGTLTLTNYFISYTIDLGALGDTRGAWQLFAPLFWLAWGAMALSAPIAALSSDRPALAIFTSFARAIAVSLRVQNAGRLCLISFAAVLPLLLQRLILDTLQQHAVGHAFFWASAPIDALTTGPLAALQTVFALDFVRRGPSTSSR